MFEDAETSYIAQMPVPVPRSSTFYKVSILSRCSLTGPFSPEEVTHLWLRNRGQVQPAIEGEGPQMVARVQH